MKRALLIAEKNSLMKTIEDVYRKHRDKVPLDITFTSQAGHLVTLLLPDELDPTAKSHSWDSLPFHPEDHGGWKYKPIPEPKGSHYKETYKQKIDRISREIHSGSYDCVIHAGDPDQEGELLVREALAFVNNVLPVKRFWTNDLTEPAILQELKNLHDDDTDPAMRNLLAAAYGRQHSDYRFGMNISRALALRMGTPVSCGRVKTPILAMVVRRENEIRNFKPVTRYGIEANYTDGFSGTFQEKTEEGYKACLFDRKDDTEAYIATIPDKAEVVSYTSKPKEEYAPKLYKLATLQVAAGSRDYNAARTLEIVQSLYEKKLMSYPRTDCEYLSSNEDFSGILRAVMAVPDLNGYIKTISKGSIEKVKHTKKWVNDAALKEHGHSALRPTNVAADISKLTSDERVIYEMVCRRFVAMFLPPLRRNEVTLFAKAGESVFKSAGKTLIDPGFSVIFGTKFQDVMIPEHRVGDILDINNFAVSEHTTQCPKRFTSASLIAACESPSKYLNDESLKALGERLKIGTSATRAGIIEELVRRKYIAEKKDGRTAYLCPTEPGEKIIINLGDCDICKVDMTGLWEERLELVRKGELTLDALENEMREGTNRMVQFIKNKDMPAGELRSRSKYADIAKEKTEYVCPLCRSPLMKQGDRYVCSRKNDSKCNIIIGATVASVDIAEEEIQKLIKTGRSSRIEGFKSKSGKNFAAYLVADPEKKAVMFDFHDGTAEDTGVKCPCCKKRNILSEQNNYYCPCGFRTGKVICGIEIPAKLFDSIRTDGITGEITGFISKKGKTFNAQLKVNKRKKTLEFDFGR